MSKTTKQPESMDDLLSQFEINVPTGTIENNNPEIILEKTAEEIAAEAALVEAAATEEKTAEEIAAEAALVEAAATKGDALYKSIALKYIENGDWSKDLAIDDGEGNIVSVSELDNIDEETFFQIQEAVKTQSIEDNKGKFISIENIDSRRKNILEIVQSGGDLKNIFKDAEEVQEYLNPFGELDLEDARVQERVYLQALVKHNGLDTDTAQIVVDKAKKDLTLDTKVKGYVENYNAKFDAFVEGKKKEVLDNQKLELEKNKAFKKELQAQYKGFNLKDSLSRKLADSAVNKVNGEFEIDRIYEKKMEDSAEAAELILFLTDKEAYLKFKQQGATIKQHKKTRQVIKIIPNKTKIKKVEENPTPGGQFEFTVKS